MEKKISFELPGKVDYFYEERPWGFMEKYAENQPCTVKRICVRHGEALSLQWHEHRDQMYIGIDPITIQHGKSKDDLKTTLLDKGGKMMFEAGTLHRAIGTHKAPFAEYFEVSFGDYDENDIHRVEDKYGRK